MVGQSDWGQPIYPPVYELNWRSLLVIITLQNRA